MKQSFKPSTPHGGGPAFPREDYQANGGNGHNLGQEGMSLRDYFAAKVLQGFAANPAVFAANSMSGWSLVNCTDADLVGYAYKIADIAVEARSA